MAGFNFARQLGVGQQWAPHCNEVRASIGQNLFGAGGVVDSADGNHWHIDHLLDGCRGADVDLVAIVGGVDHAGDQAVDHAPADVEGIHAGGHELGCHPRGFVDRPAAGDSLVPRDTQRDR